MGERIFGYVSAINDKVVFADEKLQALAKPFWGTGLRRHLSNMESSKYKEKSLMLSKVLIKKEPVFEPITKFQKETGITTIEVPKGALQ